MMQITNSKTKNDKENYYLKLIKNVKNDNVKLLKTYPSGKKFINSVIGKIELIMSKEE